MHLGTLAVVDPSSAPGGFDVNRLAALVEARSGLLGPFLRRLVEVPFGLDRPTWVNDLHLDLDRQIRPIGVPAPGGPVSSVRWSAICWPTSSNGVDPCGRSGSSRASRITHAALLTKMHHCLADGVRGARLYEVFYDLDPGAPRPARYTRASGRANPAWGGDGLASAAQADKHPAAGRPYFCPPQSLGPQDARASLFPQWLAVTLPFQAPRTSLNRSITAHRGFAYCSVPLSGVKAIKNAFTVTVNDVVLGICTGALLLLGRSRRTTRQAADRPDTCRGACQRRRRCIRGVWGNATTVMGSALPTQLDDPVERLRAIHASTRSAKVMQHALGDDLILDLADIAPPGLLAAGARAYSRLRLADHHPPIFNLIVSNVQGAPIPLYIGGMRLVASYPIGPLLDGGGLNVTVLSYLDHIDFGFVVCPEIVEDPWKLEDATSAAFTELEKAAG